MKNNETKTCYLCGQSGRAVDLLSVDELGGVSVDGRELPFGQFFCEDAEDCEASHRDRFDSQCDHSDTRVCQGLGHDMPEDSPRLDAPWWAFR